MNWREFFARDSLLWVILFYLSGAFVIGAGIISVSSDPLVDYGLSHIAVNWVLLISAIINGVSGKNGMSWSKSQKEIVADKKIADKAEENK